MGRSKLLKLCLDRVEYRRAKIVSARDHSEIAVSAPMSTERNMDVHGLWLGGHASARITAPRDELRK